MRPTQVRITMIVMAILVVATIYFIRTRGASNHLGTPEASMSPLAMAAPPAKACLPPGPPAADHVPVDMRAAIEDGKRQVGMRAFNPKDCFANPVAVKITIPRKGRVKAHKVTVMQAVTGLKRCVGDYILAVADEHGKVRIARVPEQGPSIPSGYRVTVEDGARKRGVNVPFHVEAPPNRLVVALKTAVLSRNGGTEEAVYVPYSSALDTPVLRESGLRYLEAVVEEALDYLRAQKVPSLFHVGKLVADTVERQHMTALVLTEQMKSDIAFERGNENERARMINRTLTILGANLDEAYCFTRSRVGAAGMAQLMPTTYDRLRRAYPKAKLPVDRDARLDHGWAMRAMALHADSQWWPVANDEDYKRWLLAHSEARRLVLAAGYNANAKTVVRAIKTCGETWRELSCRALPPETRRYLIKYEAVWNVLYPGSPAPLLADAGTR